MSISTLLILFGVAVAALGVLYRRVRSKDLPNLSDREFYWISTRSREDAMNGNLPQ